MNAKLIICCFIGMIALSMAAPELCAQEADTGLCRGDFPRYFYNSATGACELFTYGGCGGNTNNFELPEDCQTTCLV